MANSSLKITSFKNTHINPVRTSHRTQLVTIVNTCLLMLYSNVPQTFLLADPF